MEHGTRKLAASKLMKVAMNHKPTRREFLKETGLIGAAIGAIHTAESAAAAEKTGNELPRIRLGKLEVARLILGSNPFFGFAHKPGDVGKHMTEYYTEERIMAVMDEAADHGITAVWTPHYEHWIELWNRYQENGGRLRIWIGQPDPPAEHMKDAITACAKNGAKAICIQGERVDEQFRAGGFDVVRDWLEHIKSFGLPAGIATHKPHTHLVAEEKNLPTDFYHQCLYQPEDYSKKCRDLAIATIERLDKPVVAYKVLAAGRLDPKEAFPHVFKHLESKDGICVGVFPKDDPDQAEENAALTYRLSRKAS